jgi:hypothetical protein
MHGATCIFWANLTPFSLVIATRSDHLDPTVSRDAWTDEENKKLLEIYDRLGTKWARIAELLPGRPANGCRIGLRRGGGQGGL